jgi:thioredoxin 1
VWSSSLNIITNTSKDAGFAIFPTKISPNSCKRDADNTSLKAVFSLGWRNSIFFSHYLKYLFNLKVHHKMSDQIIHTSDDAFEQDVLQSQLPVLVDYWAEWCGPCKMIAPILDEVAKEYEGRVKVAKLNIDENQNTPPKYGIRGIPTLMLFKNGNVEATKVGALSKSQLTAFIDSNI